MHEITLNRAQLNGSYGNQPWNESLSSLEYDTAFLALKTVMDRDATGRSAMGLQRQLELTDQIVMALRVDDTELMRLNRPGFYGDSVC